MSRTLCVLWCCLLLAAPADAQLDAPTKRPQLGAGADTNDAFQYYNYGLQVLRRNPASAADAFYWAERLNPEWADALYARRVALLLQQPNKLERYWSGDRRTLQSKDIRRIDSLYFRALTQNPFLYEKLDRTLFDAMIHKWAEDYVGPGHGGAMDVEYEIQNYVRQSGAATRAWLAYSDGRFDEALQLWADAMKSTKSKALLHVRRGKLFFQVGRADSAYAEFTQALDELRKRDAKDLVDVYESKALIEQAIGMIHEQRDSLAAAREAYSNALQEDLSYYPAHVHLGFLAMASKDTATAFNEMELAVQIRPNSPILRYVYGYALGTARKYPEAETQLRRATEIEPLFALPHAVLGQLYEEQHKSQDALKEYRDYLARASRGEPRRQQVEARVAVLASGNAGGGPK